MVRVAGLDEDAFDADFFHAKYGTLTLLLDCNELSFKVKAVDMELCTLPHSVFNIKAHLILVTGCRRLVISAAVMADLERYIQRQDRLV